MGWEASHGLQSMRYHIAAGFKKFIIIIIKGVTPASHTQRYYIASGLGEEEREEYME